MEEKKIKHYSSHHKILLVGEGDFSFSLSLANAFGSASNMVATSLDSKGVPRGHEHAWVWFSSTSIFEKHTHTY